MREKLKEEGYDKEEDYFKRLEIELIKKRKAQREAEEAKRKQEEQTH